MERITVEEVAMPRPMIVIVHKKGRIIEWNTLPGDLNDEETRYVLVAALMTLNDKIALEKSLVTAQEETPNPDDNAPLSPDKDAANGPVSPAIADASSELIYEPLDDASAIVDDDKPASNVRVMPQLHRGKARDKVATTPGQIRKKKA